MKNAFNNFRYIGHMIPLPANWQPVLKDGLWTGDLIQTAGFDKGTPMRLWWFEGTLATVYPINPYDRTIFVFNGKYILEHQYI